MEQTAQSQNFSPLTVLANNNQSMFTPPPQVPAPTSNQGSLKLVIGLLVVIIILLSAVVAGGAYYLLTFQNQKEEVAETFNQPVNPPVEENITPQPTVAPLQVVNSQDRIFQVSLDKVSLGEKIVTLNFTAKNISDRMQTFPANTADLAKSYLTEETSSMKYEVVKDADGKSLVSTIDYKWFQVGETYSFYIQLTAPPKGSMVNINIPNLMPFVGVKIE